MSDNKKEIIIFSKNLKKLNLENNLYYFYILTCKICIVNISQSARNKLFVS